MKTDNYAEQQRTYSNDLNNMDGRRLKTQGNEEDDEDKIQFNFQDNESQISLDAVRLPTDFTTKSTY